MAEKNINRKRIKKFISYYKPYKKIFILDMIFAIISAITVLLFPLISGYITKEVLTEWNDTTLKSLMIAGGVMLLLVIIKSISCLLFAYWGHSMGAKMEGDMRNELFKHYGKLSFNFFSNESVGKLMTIISNDLTSMTELFHHGPEDIVMTIIKLGGAFLVLININVPLTLILFSVFPILCIVAIYTDKLMEKGLIKAKAHLSSMNEKLEDTLSGIRTVKAFGNEDYEYKKFKQKNEEYVKSKCYFYKVEAYFYEIVEAYPQFLTMLVVFFGALFIMKGSIDVPVLVTFLLYVSCLYEPVKTMINFMKLYEEGKASFIRFMDMIEIEPSVKESKNPIYIDKLKGKIEFNNVSFAYEDGSESVIEDISLAIKEGKNIAIVGASGIGKSTMSSLISRFYDVTRGELTIDDVNIKDISFKSIRDNIGIVQQEVFIFNGTLKENILYGNEKASDDEVELAARLANAHEFISKLKDGYDTVIGTHGITLSGGQRQRISLARVFLKNPSILILDEATSALDYESEVLVQESINDLMKNRTCIIIAHRLSTIKNADKIIVLSDKTIIEEGTHNELIEKGGEYSKLCNIGYI